MAFSKHTLKILVVLALIAAALVLFGRELIGGSTNGWKTDFDRATISMDEVISGGVPRDGIPPIDNPRFKPVQSVTDLSEQSPVIAVNIDDDARAYPLEVLIRHEIVNDVVGGIPVAVTFCPLCNSAVVFDRRVEGETLRFGVSGNLRYSDLIMWDNATESWWQQLTGEGIVGAYSGYYLEFVTSQLISFGIFRDRYPEGQVLRGPSGAYGRNPYQGYDRSDSPFLFRGSLDKRLHPSERVLAGEVAGQAVAYPFVTLRQSHVINDSVNGEEIVGLWQAGAASALDKSDIDSSRDVGMALMYSRQLDNGRTLTFCYADDSFMDNETNSRWNIFGEAIDGPLKGAKLRQYDAAAHFWFAWAAFHPDTLLKHISRDEQQL